MRETVTPISAALSDVLTGAYARKRVTQQDIADRADMSLVTVQKKLRGRSPISATDLVVLSRAIGVDPASVLTDALDELDSRTSVSPVIIPEQWRKKRPSEMTEGELDVFEGASAANTDDELGHDEPTDT